MITKDNTQFYQNIQVLALGALIDMVWPSIASCYRCRLWRAPSTGSLSRWWVGTTPTSSRISCRSSSTSSRTWTSDTRRNRYIEWSINRLQNHGWVENSGHQTMSQSCCCGRLSQQAIGIDCCRQSSSKMWSRSWSFATLRRIRHQFDRDSERLKLSVIFVCNIFGTPRKNSFKICFKFETLQELEVEVELLKEDNEQLVTQYEREKVNIK